MSNWNWTEITTDEFEKRRLTETYYRIYHKENDNDIIDYKFWAKDDNIALDTLKVFKEEHIDDNEYFYSTSWYNVSSDGKHFDTLEDLHKSWKKAPYDDEDRKYDIEKINDFYENTLNKNKIDILVSLRDKLNECLSKIDEYEKAVNDLKFKTKNTDLNTTDKKTMDYLRYSGSKLTDKFYELSDLDYLLKTKHHKTESYSLYTHILEDIRFNVKKMLQDEFLGYPTSYNTLAACELNIEIDRNLCAKNDDDSSRLSDKASYLWKRDLTEFLDNINHYIYFSEYGIFDENDKDMVDFDKLHKHEIPYKFGMDKSIDYKQLSKLVEKYWNKIWDFMKTNGYNLWT